MRRALELVLAMIDWDLTHSHDSITRKDNKRQVISRRQMSSCMHAMNTNCASALPDFTLLAFALISERRWYLLLAELDQLPNMVVSSLCILKQGTNIDKLVGALICQNVK